MIGFLVMACLVTAAVYPEAAGILVLMVLLAAKVV